MRNLLILVPVLALAACGSESMDTNYSENGTKASLIAKVKDCELWKVRDGSIRHVYMNICETSNGGTTQFKIDKTNHSVVGNN